MKSSLSFKAGCQVSDSDVVFSANQKAVQELLQEHCDGNRNILHTIVAMCVPTSNKDADKSETNAPGTGPNFTSTLEAINAVSSAVDALTAIQSRSVSSPSDPSSRG